MAENTEPEEDHKTDEDKPVGLSIFDPLVIWTLCLVLTPLAGAYLHFRWKKDFPEMAAYANRVSWISAGIWAVILVIFRMATPHAPRYR